MADDALADGTATPPSSDVRWEKTYFGLPATVSRVRRDVRDVLGPCPEFVADDVSWSSRARGQRHQALAIGR